MKKTLIENKEKIIIVFCYVINFLIPILFFKEISSKLLPDELGYFFFHLAIIVYLQYIIEYGFQVSIIKELHDYINQSDLFSKEISNILFFRLFIFLIIIIYVFNTEINNELKSLYLILIGNVFSFQFIYQVHNKLKDFYITSLITKMAFIPLIFSINSKHAILLYILFNIIPNLIIFIYSKVKFNIKIFSINIKDIIKLIKNKFSFFISNISITLYTSFYQLLLGIFNPILLPAYALSDKLIRSIVAGNYIFIQMLQVNYMNKSNLYNKKKRIKTISIIFTLGIMESISLSIFSYFISYYLFSDINGLFYILVLMSILITIIILSNLFGMVFLTCSSNVPTLSKIFLFSAFFSVIYSPVLIYLFNIYGAIISAIISESLVLVLCYLSYRKIFSINKNGTI
ncbi:oligosaccharide flippase family protein [Xenorhabdus sp. PB62.4]|uniref:oligosaccharide flippase family protein n=1 Tax=Xenorhabdus sp. PB62.4 TaxID=1851573 RepID=UPI001656C646|nr:oligosaccharide flippase family protein [Xenorhabdus sp. PB62.4]MBC8954432.1 translocase [Xenorhabdus sp. PB62.4]